MKCFCNGHGKYTDYNCGQSFSVTCPHCQGSGTKKCSCETAGTSCEKYGRGHEIVETPTRRFSEIDDDEDDNPHWMFMD